MKFKIGNYVDRQLLNLILIEVFSKTIYLFSIFRSANAIGFSSFSEFIYYVSIATFLIVFSKFGVENQQLGNSSKTFFFNSIEISFFKLLIYFSFSPLLFILKNEIFTIIYFLGSFNVLDFKWKYQVEKSLLSYSVLRLIGLMPLLVINLLFTEFSLKIFIILYSIQYLPTSFELIYVIIRKNFLFDFHKIKIKIIKYLGKWITLGTSALVYQSILISDRVVLGYFGNKDLAIYDLGYRICNVFFFLGVIQWNYYAPLIKKSHKYFKKYRFQRIFLAIVAPIIILFFSKINFYIEMIDSSITDVSILISISLIFVFLNGIYVAPLALGKNQSAFLKINLIGGISNLIINLLLIPSLGINGAIISTIIAELLILASSKIFFGNKDVLQ